MDENPESEIAESLAPVGLAANAFTAGDVEQILREPGWLGLGAASDDRASRLQDWLAGTAALLGPHAADRAALAELLGLIFHYDAAATLATREAQAVIMRTGAREVIRELAKLILDGAAIDSGRFKEIVEALKLRVRFRSRELFHPIRLALVGRVGEGDLVRVILLLDSAAELEFAARVKGTRERMLEFCAALE